MPEMYYDGPPTRTSERNETKHWRLMESWRDEGEGAWLHHHHPGGGLLIMGSSFITFSTLHHFPVLSFFFTPFLFLHIQRVLNGVLFIDVFLGLLGLVDSLIDWLRLHEY